MNNGFVKLYGTILTSSVWVESTSTRIVWITLLALADKDGFVAASLPGLAHAANVSVPECEAAMRVLCAPDAHSRTKDFDGRRVEEADGGWVVLNRTKYRDLRTDKQAQEAERQAKHRRKSEGYVYYAVAGRRVKIGHSRNPWARANELRCALPDLEIAAVEDGGLAMEQQRHQEFAKYRVDREWFELSDELKAHIGVVGDRSNASSRMSRTEKETEKEKTTTRRVKIYPADFEPWWKGYPNREGSVSKSKTYECWKARQAEGHDVQTMYDGRDRFDTYVKHRAWIGTRFVMQPQTFLGPDLHFLNPWTIAADPEPVRVLKLTGTGPKSSEIEW